MKKIIFAALFAVISLATAQAQTANGRATTTTPTYSNGVAAPLSLDLSGSLRVVNSGSPSGTQDVNLTKILGAAPSLTNPLWVFPATGATFPVSGTVWQATQPVSGTFWQATQPVSGTFWQATQPVSGTFWQATQPVSGPLTDTQLRATPVPVSGTVTATNAANGSTGASVPASATYVGANSAGNLTGIIQASASVAINVSSATTTQLVALSGSTKIYVTSFDAIAGGTGNITFVYGTGSSCGTGTTSLTGAYNLTAQAGIAKGNGLGPVLVVPAGNALCVTTSAAVQMSGSVAYTQF